MARSVLFVALVVVSLCAFASAVGSKKIIDAPPQCPEGQKPDANGKCQDDWGRSGQVSQSDDTRNVIQIPPSCPPCYRPDAAGVCRAIFGCQY